VIASLLLWRSVSVSLERLSLYLLSPKKADQPTVAAFALHDTLVNDSTSDEAGWAG
jgi:hypothetical protein